MQVFAEAQTPINCIVTLPQGLPGPTGAPGESGKPGDQVSFYL